MTSGTFCSTKFTQPPLLSLLLGQFPYPLGADILYEWSHSCYDVYAHPDDRAGFEAAQAVCRENGGGHLVQIEDQTESDFVSGSQFNEKYLLLEKS